MRPVIVTTVLVAAIAVQPSSADVENRVFTSRSDRLQVVVPRGWKESEAPSYPGLLLWMMTPTAKMVLTAEPFSRQLYCSWPAVCRSSQEIGTVLGKFACALSQQLTAQHMRVSAVQAGPRENQDAGLPTVWFEYDDGKHFTRQAVALTDDRAISLVLSARTADARSASIRAFETALRSLQRFDSTEAADPGSAPSVSKTPLSPVGPCLQR